MTRNPNSEYDAIIVGAGLAGLSCALELQRAGKRFVILESSDRVGGRMRTDRHEGFLLDHGFQVLLTAYEECQRLLDYDTLRLGRFEPGAYVWTGRKLELVADPIRQPSLLFQAISSSVGTLSDKLKVAGLKRRLSSRSVDEIYRQPEKATRLHLRQLGFSEAMIERFLKPFFRGIFLEEDLETSNRMFDFVFKMFSQGHATLPEAGMQAIPQQLSAQLPSESLRLNAPVSEIDARSVTMLDGSRLAGKAVILATGMSEARRLCPSLADRGWNATRCAYFAADRSPFSRPMIALNGSGRGSIRNVCVPSDVTPSYAPAGQSLICVSVAAGADSSGDSVKAELRPWIGDQADELRFLRSYRIEKALPRQLPGDLPFEEAKPKTDHGIWVCGDHRHSSSIQGALRSGRKVGEALLERL